MRHEAAVIGAGPAGILAARRLAEHGFSPIVFEEHHEIGEPCHCAGLISVQGLGRLGVEPLDSFHQNTVYGGRVYAPNGECVEINLKKPMAYVVDRAAFDRHLAETASDAGAEFSLGTRVEELKLRAGESPKLRVGGSELAYGAVVDAEGPAAHLLRRAGFDTGQTGIINGFNTELEAEAEPDLVELWFREGVAKNFFAWVIPLGDGRVRVGLGTAGEDGVERLRRFTDERFGREPANVRAGLICTGGPVRRTVYDGLLLVGDSAGQVKATTGGGVVIGGLCAAIAGDAAAESLEGGDLGRLMSYERRWRAEYGFELTAMLGLRNALNTLSDDLLVRLYEAFRDEGLQGRLQRLVEAGDMDMQAGVIREALTDPWILAALIRCVGRVAVGELTSLFE